MFKDLLIDKTMFNFKRGEFSSWNTQDNQFFLYRQTFNSPWKVEMTLDKAFIPEDVLQQHSQEIYNFSKDETFNTIEEGLAKVNDFLNSIYPYNTINCSLLYSSHNQFIFCPQIYPNLKNKSFITIRPTVNFGFTLSPKIIYSLEAVGMKRRIFTTKPQIISHIHQTLSEQLPLIYNQEQYLLGKQALSSPTGFNFESDKVKDSWWTMFIRPEIDLQQIFI